MKLAVLLVSRDRPDLVHARVAELDHRLGVPFDLIVAECGVDPARLTQYTSVWCPDAAGRGPCAGHQIALAAARLRGRYDAYWVLSADVALAGSSDPVAAALLLLASEERLALLAPREDDGATRGDGWRVVTSAGELGFLVKAAAVEECGFLEPELGYESGALLAFAHELYSRGWCVAESDAWRCRRVAVAARDGADALDAGERRRRAQRAAFAHFRDRWGEDWDARFWRAAAPFGPARDGYAEHKREWAQAFSAEERRACGVDELEGAPPRAGDTLGSERRVRLYLGGAAAQPAEGLRANPDGDSSGACAPDRLASIQDGTVDVVEAREVVERLGFHETRRALGEWARVLRPGGELHLELPDLEASLRLVGRAHDEHGLDLGLLGIFGRPASEDDGAQWPRRWGWTRASLTRELHRAGFVCVCFGPIGGPRSGTPRGAGDVRVSATKGLPTRRAELPRASAG